MNKKSKPKKNSKLYPYNPRTGAPLLPAFLLNQFITSFTEGQRQILFKMFGYYMDWAKSKVQSNINFFKEYSAIIYFFQDQIIRDVQAEFTLTKNGLNTLICLYYMESILNRPVKLKEVQALFKRAHGRGNKTSGASLTYLFKIGLVNKLLRSTWVVTPAGFRVIKYLSVRMIVYKRQFIKKQSELEFIDKHSKI